MRLALRAVAKATLSSLVPAVNSATSSIPSLLKISENMVHPGGLLALRLALRAVAKATLSSLVLAVSTATSSIPSSLKITENMVHPGGFEPPTARFVAEYSIQLSYGCIGKIYFTADIDIATKAISSKRWCIREDYSPCGSPFGPLLKQRYPPWCLRLVPPPLRYLHR